MHAETSAREAGPTVGTFVQRQLPWVLAAVALIFYLFTLGRSVSPNGLPDLVRAAGWDWKPAYVEPLWYLLTFPIRWVPPGWQIMALNLLSAICSAAALGLLARSVVILPHDRTRDQRFMERSDYSWLTIPAAWVPPVLAVLVCGLQLTFWENTVVATGEALDLLLFAYVIRELLEFRIDQKESRLTRAALVYGLGITNNFAFIGFFPVFLVVLLWIRGMAFFNLRFLLKMALFGLAGLSLYLLLPLIQTLNPQTGQSFLEMLRFTLGHQKSMLLSFPKGNLLLIGLSSLVPVLFMGIKWPASFGDISAAGTALTNLMMHVIHGLLLVACLAIAFDPQFSPRKLAGIYGYPMLPFYFLSALSIGYFAGYFLLVFRPSHAGKGWRRPSVLGLWLNRSLTALIWIALVAAPAGLVYRNLPHILANTRPYLSQFGQLQAATLREVAPQGAIVLSDDPYRLFALDSALRRSGHSDRYVLVDTTSLQWAAYHRHLNDRYPQHWMQPPANIQGSVMLDPGRLIQLISYLNQSHEIYYLHPSFGYYFEQFYLTPRKLLYRLRPYGANSVVPPALSEEELAGQEQFWTDFKAKELSPLLAELKRLRIKKEPNMSLALAGSMYSRSVNDFAVLLQKAGQLEKAAAWFETAVELNPDNPSAFINLDYNQLLRAGQRENPKPSEGVLRRLTPYGGDFDRILGLNGAVDEPNICYRLAEAFARGRNFRQAAQQLSRVLEFAPDHFPAHLALVSMLNQIHYYDQSLAAIKDIRTRFATNLVNSSAAVELVQAEAIAHLGRQELSLAEQILVRAQKDYPQSMEPFATLAEIYVGRGQVTNALKVLDQALQNQPEQPVILTHYARLLMLNSNFNGAIPYLDRALQANNKDVFALLNRAIAHLKSDHLDEAQRDYESLEMLAPNVYPVCYGLHEVHWRKKHRKTAIKYAEQFLKAAPAHLPEVTEFKDRLARLKSGSF